MARSNAAMMMHRAEALALVSLTRNKFVNPMRADIGDLDFLALVRENEELLQLRFFGVIVKASTQVDSRSTADRHGKILNREQRITSKKYLFPVLVLLFSMEQETGYYAWVMEPNVDSLSPKLKEHHDLEFSEFDRTSLDFIVDQVDLWYRKASTFFT